MPEANPAPSAAAAPPSVPNSPVPAKPAETSPPAAAKADSSSAAAAPSQSAVPAAGTAQPEGASTDAKQSNTVAQALTDLQTAMSDAKTTAVQIEDKIAAVRKARLKARRELEIAQKDLLDLLSPSQQAVLMTLGYID
jgi:hypothetical protein